jgi:hypothetical protein
MIFLRLTGAAAFSLLSLPGWERERVADAVLLLTTDPRPPFTRRLAEVTGEAFEVWVGERRIEYRVYKDDENIDQIVLVTNII